MILAETMARDLLLKVYEGRRYMSIQPQDVEEILSNDEFTTKEGFLTTVEKTVSITSLLISEKKIYRMLLLVFLNLFCCYSNHRIHCCIWQLGVIMTQYYHWCLRRTREVKSSARQCK